MTLLEFVGERCLAAFLKSGIPEDEARSAVAQIDEELRANYGARANYIHGENLALRDAKIRSEWARELARNEGSGNPVRIGYLRDQLCGRFGISRRTFYRTVSQQMP
jgi:hypothetical protein